MRLLVVDDSPGFLRLMRESLNMLGYSEVDFAYSGSEARECLHNNSYDVVLLDYFLPDESGCEVARWISSLESDINIILITAEPNCDCEKYPVLLKPVNIEELAEQLKVITNDNQTKK